MTDLQVITTLKTSVLEEARCLTLSLPALLEMEERELFLQEGCSSTWKFCVEKLGLCENSASKRIRVARAMRTFPLMLEYLKDNRLNLTNAAMLCRHLTEDNQRSLLSQACGKSKYDVEKLIAAIAPQPDVRDTIRRVGQAELALEDTSASPAPKASPEPSVAKLKPLSATRTKITFTADDELVAQFRKLQSLMRHKFPRGNFEDIAKAAFELLIKKVDPARCPERVVTPKVPKKHMRYIPAHLRRSVWKRDGGQCTFITKNGERCSETGFLQIDHVAPFSRGGSSWDEKNLRLQCSFHNRGRHPIAARREKMKTKPAPVTEFF